MDGKRIRVRITAVAVLLLLVCAGLLMFASYRRTSRSISDQLEVNYGIAAEKYAQELTAWINTNATIIEALAAEITESGVDLGDAFDMGGKILTDLKTYIPNGNTAFASLVASNKESVISKINDILTFFK